MIKGFYQFIQEKVGVNLTSLKYVDIISEEVKERLKSFLQESSSNIFETIKIDSNKIKDAIGGLDDYKKFPVASIEVSVNFNKTNKNNPEKNWSVGGGAFPFGHKNWKQYSRKTDSILTDLDFGIIIKLEVSIDIWKSFPINEINLLNDEINSTIWHECNHLYDAYNRFLNKKGKVLDRALKISLSYIDQNRWKIKKEIFEFWSNDFIYLIYISEPYEINARVQELAYYVIKYGFDSIKDKQDYLLAKNLKEFKSDEFIKKLVDIIQTVYPPENTEYILSRLKKMLLSEYKRALIMNKEKPTLDISKLEKLNFNDFIKFFEKRFNNSGDRFFKKIIKLNYLDEKV